MVFEAERKLNGQKWKKPFYATLGSLSIIVLIWTMLPRPVENRQRSLPADHELLDIIEQFQLPLPERSDRKLAAFGKELFFSPLLSKNGDVSCATCHQPDLDFTDGLPVAKGTALTHKNTPSLLNSYAASWFFWDGRSDNLANQVLGPLEHRSEHGLSRTGLIKKVNQHFLTQYEQYFGSWPTALSDLESLPDASPRPSHAKLSLSMATYGLTTLSSSGPLSHLMQVAQRQRQSASRLFTDFADQVHLTNPDEYAALPEPTRDAISQVAINIGKAIAAYERGLVANQSPFDIFVRRALANQSIAKGMHVRFGAHELAGLKLFTGPAGCTKCHNGPLLSDQQFHNIGLPYLKYSDENIYPEDLYHALPVGRAIGVIKAMRSRLNCRNPQFADDPVYTDTESCRELPYLATENRELMGAFKTPSLRNLLKTAPYMHDGRFATLKEVLQHYSELDDIPAIGHREESLQPLQLTHSEMESLERFLKSLQSPVLDLTGTDIAKSSQN